MAKALQRNGYRPDKNLMHRMIQRKYQSTLEMAENGAKRRMSIELKKPERLVSQKQTAYNSIKANFAHVSN